MNYRITNNKLALFFTCGIYLGINCFYNTISIDFVYDLIFALIVFTLGVQNNRISKKIVLHDKLFNGINVILMLPLVNLILSTVAYGYSFFPSLFTAREMLYFIVAYFFSSGRVDKQKIIRTIIKLEAFSCLFYIVNFIISHPISPFAYFKASSVYVGGLSIYRDFSPLPLLPSFSCVFLIIGILNKEYCFSKKKDILTLLLLFFTVLIKMFKTKLLVMVFGAILGILITRKTFKKARKKSRKIFICSAIVIAFFVFTSPVLRDRFIGGFSEFIIALKENSIDPFHGTGIYRIWLLQSRIRYLQSNGKLLFGMGLVPSDSQVEFFKTGSMVGSMATVYNPDSSYLTLLARYGVVGIVVYISSLIFISRKLFKNKDKISISVAVFLICQIVEGLCGNEMLAQYGPLLMGMMIGLASNSSGPSEKMMRIKTAATM